jgi:hypothetical protein
VKGAQVAIEAKPFASLSSGLLARKGAARPAMRPQGFGQVGQTLEDLGWNDMGFEPPKPAVVARDADHDAFGEDVVEHPRAHPTGLTPVQSPVHDQQAQIADRLSADEEEDLDETAGSFEPESVDETPVARAPESVDEAPVVRAPLVAAATSRRAPLARSSPGTKAKAAFTLRLDPERHLKLRLACAVDGRSAQQIVTAALDRLLEQMPELEAMAGKAKRKG